MLPKGDVFTGPRARLIVNARVIGFAQSVTVSEDLGYEPVEVLDNIEVQEHVPVSYNVGMTAGRVRLVRRSLAGPALNIFPKTGNNPQEHLANILGFDLSPMEALIEDTVTGQIIMLMEQVKITGRGFTVAARSVVGEDISFVGIRVKDESET